MHEPLTEVQRVIYHPCADCIGSGEFPIKFGKTQFAKFLKSRDVCPSCNGNGRGAVKEIHLITAEISPTCTVSIGGGDA